MESRRKRIPPLEKGRIRKDCVERVSIGRSHFEGMPVTVCIAGLMRWNYGSRERPEVGFAAIALSDRKLTAGDVEYEPNQRKVAILKNILVMVAGDFALHSQAIKNLFVHFNDESEPQPYDTALFYGAQIQALKRRQAEDLYLGPLGLNTDSFIAQQNDMSAHFISTVTEQLQNYRGPDVEAIIVGRNKHNGGDLYVVDNTGTVSLLSDVGVAAIGIGAYHAKSQLMQTRYTNAATYVDALASLFAAKKAAEAAPGVSKSTDIHLVFRNDIVLLNADLAQRMELIYNEYQTAREALVTESLGKLDKAVVEIAEAAEAHAKANQNSNGTNAQINERPNPNAPEGTHPDEAGKNKG